MKKIGRPTANNPANIRGSVTAFMATMSAFLAATKQAPVAWRTMRAPEELREISLIERRVENRRRTMDRKRAEAMQHAA